MVTCIFEKFTLGCFHGSEFWAQNNASGAWCGTPVVSSGLRKKTLNRIVTTDEPDFFVTCSGVLLAHFQKLRNSCQCRNDLRSSAGTTDSVRRKRPRLLLLHHNAIFHAVLTAQETVRELRWELPDHPPFKPRSRAERLSPLRSADGTPYWQSFVRWYTDWTWGADLATITADAGWRGCLSEAGKATGREY